MEVNKSKQFTFHAKEIQISQLQGVRIKRGTKHHCYQCFVQTILVHHPSDLVAGSPESTDGDLDSVRVTWRLEVVTGRGLELYCRQTRHLRHADHLGWGVLLSYTLDLGYTSSSSFNTHFSFSIHQWYYAYCSLFKWYLISDCLQPDLY